MKLWKYPLHPGRTYANWTQIEYSNFYHNQILSINVPEPSSLVAINEDLNNATCAWFYVDSNVKNKVMSVWNFLVAKSGQEIIVPEGFALSAPSHQRIEPSEHNIFFIFTLTRTQPQVNMSNLILQAIMEKPNKKEGLN